MQRRISQVFWGIALIDNSSPPCKTGKTTGEIVFDVPRMAEIVRPNRRFEFPETHSVCHPPARRNASHRRDVRLQSRLFANWNQSLRHSPNSTRFLEIVSDNFPVLHTTFYLHSIRAVSQTLMVERASPRVETLAFLGKCCRNCLGRLSPTA